MRYGFSVFTILASLNYTYNKDEHYYHCFKVSEACGQYVSVKILHYELVLETDISTSHSNTPFVLCLCTLTGMFLFSISHLFLSLGSYPRNINPDLWIFFFLPTTLFMGRNTLLCVSITY